MTTPEKRQKMAKLYEIRWIVGEIAYGERYPADEDASRDEIWNKFCAKGLDKSKVKHKEITWLGKYVKAKIGKG